uniref:Uncharacterized protein n=1 Tax=Zea mays TaxID=4577 RepID=C4J3X9_MAIZE|nr:unknown [Zea mays]
MAGSPTTMWCEEAASTAAYAAASTWRLRPPPPVEWRRCDDGGKEEMGTTEDAAAMASGGAVETGAEAASGDAKLGQAPRLRCSEAVRDGLEAENVAAQSVQRRRANLGCCPEAGGGTSTGSRCAQYQAPLPLMALARTCTSDS